MSENTNKTTNTEKMTYEAVFRHSNCKYNDLKKYLVDSGKMSLNTLKYHLFDKEKSMIEKGHLESASIRKYGDNKYPEDFTINEEFLSLYPELKRIKIQELNIELKKVEASLNKPNINREDQIYHMLMERDTKIYIEQNPTSKPMVFSDRRNNWFNGLIQMILHECILYNPDMWYIFEKPTDMDFKITIETNYSSDPDMFEYFKIIRDDALDNGLLKQTYGRVHGFFSEALHRKIGKYIALEEHAKEIGAHIEELIKKINETKKSELNTKMDYFKERIRQLGSIRSGYRRGIPIDDTNIEKMYAHAKFQEEQRSSVKFEYSDPVYGEGLDGWIKMLKAMPPESWTYKGNLEEKKAGIEEELRKYEEEIEI